MKLFLKTITVILMLNCILLPLLAGETGVSPAAEKVVIEKVIHDSIGWALTKDRALLESTLAQDDQLFIFNPDSQSTVGWDQFVKGFDFWMDPRFKATTLDIRELRLHLSPSGDAAWWSCILDDLGQWDGQPIGWKDTRWTGVLEKRAGTWLIVQMHFSFASDKVAAEVKAKLQATPNETSDKTYRIQTQISGPFNINSYLLYDPQTKDAAIMDAGSDMTELLTTIQTKGLKLHYIFLTHAHQDHVATVLVLKQKFPQAQLCYSQDEFSDAPLYKKWQTLFEAQYVAQWEKNPAMLALMNYDYDKMPAPDTLVKNQQVFPLGTLRIQALKTPGHSRGSITYAVADILFTGDLLLYHASGYMNYALASKEAIVASIRQLYATFPENTIIHSGHGKPSTIGYEKKQNTQVTDTTVTWDEESKK